MNIQNQTKLTNGFPTLWSSKQVGNVKINKNHTKY